MESSNRKLLDEVNAARSWFHAKRTRPIWAKKVDKRQTVETLEGTEEVGPGNYLCRSETGDIWPQNAERLTAKFSATDDISDDGWQKFEPKPDVSGVLAAQVDHPFTVRSQWGTLIGKPDDYLVKDADEADAPYPNDLWIVDRARFHATYEVQSP